MKRLFLLLCLLGALVPVSSAQDNPFGIKGVKAESSYSFNSSMTYKMTSTDRKGRSSWMTNQYFFSDNGTAIGMKLLETSENGKTGIDFMVIDVGKARIFTFMESKMVMGIAMRADKLNESIEKENAGIRVSKTSETKTIMGYECEGYSIKNDKDKLDIMMWVTKTKVESMARLAKEMARSFGGASKGNQTNYFAYNAHPELAKMAKEGRAVLGYTTRTDKGEVTEMELIKIEPGITFTFKASDYKSMF